MWLFGRSNSESDDSSNKLSEVTHAQRQRNKQISWLKEQVSSVIEVERDRRYTVSFPVNEYTITLNINLSDRFPLDSPKVTASPYFFHPWVDEQMVVVGSPLIKHFNPHSNLGRVIKQVIDEFIEHPPQFDQPVAMTALPQIYPTPMSQQPYTGTSGLSYTPFSYSSVLSHEYTNSSNTSPTQILPPSSPSPIAISSSNDYKYTVPDVLPGLSEKSDESLEKYLNDEDSVVLIDRFISRLEVIKKVQEDMEHMFQQHEKQAKLNVEMEPHLQVKWSRLQEKHLELQSCKETYDKLYQQQIQIMERYDRRNAFIKLKTLTQEADTESDITAEEFLEQKIDITKFLQKFLHERKLYHLRASKSELMKYHRT